MRRWRRVVILTADAAQRDWRRRRHEAGAQVVVVDLVDRPAAADVQQILLDDRGSAGVNVAERARLRSENSEVDFVFAQTAGDEVVQAIDDHIQVAQLIEAHA